MTKELLFSVTKEDLRISYFSGKGAGGQYRNRHMNCVRIFHPDSGASSVGQSYKSKQSNLKEALKNLVKQPKFKIWVNRQVNDSLVRERVEDLMKPEFLKIEVKTAEGWRDYYKGDCD